MKQHLMLFLLSSPWLLAAYQMIAGTVRNLTRR
jgi:hypothetical protein